MRPSCPQTIPCSCLPIAGSLPLVPTEELGGLLHGEDPLHQTLVHIFIFDIAYGYQTEILVGQVGEGKPPHQTTWSPPPPTPS